MAADMVLPSTGRLGAPGAWHASGFAWLDMSFRTGLVVVVALAALTVYPPPAQVGVRDPQPAAAARKAASAPQPSVTLEHQLIQIEPVEPVEPTRRPKPAPRLRRTLPPTRLAYGPVPQESLGVRARRVVLGDGRFRPEPFPRLDR
jgi:hypothetical protein